MQIDDEIETLKDLDRLRTVRFERCKCFLHEEHRWALPLVHFAQRKESLPTPCTLIMFDFHSDSNDPNCIDEIYRMRKEGVCTESIISLCEKNLSRLNNDWVKAGMELGLIDDAVVFGVSSSCNQKTNEMFRDRCGGKHMIYLLNLPGRELDYQGKLSESHDKNILSPLWNILGWQLGSEGRFSFTQKRTGFLVDIDLDCFVIRWSDYHFPWSDEVFKKEFLKPSESSSAKGWTGKKFLDELINRAGLVTIARESGCCGGESKADQILRRVNHFLLDDKLFLKWRCTHCGQVYERLEAGECATCGHPTSHYELLSDD